MEADDLLDQLGRHVRDETSASATVADDPVWGRLAREDRRPWRPLDALVRVLDGS